MQSSIVLPRLGRHFGVNTIDELCQRLHYRGPVELLSMHLCFAGSPDLDKYDFERMLPKLLRQQASKYRGTHKQDAIPAVLLAYAYSNGAVHLL